MIIFYLKQLETFLVSGESGLIEVVRVKLLWNAKFPFDYTVAELDPGASVYSW